jgi:uncharacterized protein (TIGR02145 family)
LENGSSGFSALLGGYRHTDGSFGLLGVDGFYWSATEYSAGNAWYYSFSSRNGKLSRLRNDKRLDFSCRCVQGAPSNGKD